MTGKEAYKTWAPAGKKWVDWVRPVSFVATSEYSKSYNVSDITVSKVEFLGMGHMGADCTETDCTKADCAETAIIVDLPGGESVKEGIALAKCGFRPIPVFNGTIEQQGARATTDNQSAGMALLSGAAELSRIVIGDDAPPAFLLDSNRLNRYKMEVSLFDNSWDIYPQDIPSPEYMISNGIRKIVIVGDSLARDLKKVLYEFQKKGIEILFTKGYEAPKKVKIQRPLRRDKD